eukprot:TRINITY_DN43042_c0_g1_i1.p1 TRINITY_DN43042_c0_g1~~TRINITY_DN43042_c0_g1_i1.p1  ORF type:complete len:446 (+),score=63.52 TRINITY_DN43042_c0_g1_i1:63-1340(+)
MEPSGSLELKVQTALADGAESVLLEACTCLSNQPREALIELACAPRSHETWSAHFLRALYRTVASDWRLCVWSLLAALTDARLPPPRSALFEAQFGDPEFLKLVMSALSVDQPVRLRIVGCQCTRNLARALGVRRGLLAAGAVEVLAAALLSSASESVGEHKENAGAVSAMMAAAAAAALCNVACSPGGKETAVSAGCVPPLLAALRADIPPSDADDIAACLGVLTGNFDKGVLAVFACESGAVPLVEALRREDTTLQGTILDVLGGIAVLLSQPETDAGRCSAHLANNSELVRRHLPRLVVSPHRSVRGAALKLCMLLHTGSDSFGAAFLAAGGEQMLRHVMALEPAVPGPPSFTSAPPPPVASPELLLARGTRTKARQTPKFCMPDCASTCCFPSSPAAGGPFGQMPTQGQLAEDLLSQLLQS